MLGLSPPAASPARPLARKRVQEVPTVYARRPFPDDPRDEGMDDPPHARARTAEQGGEIRLRDLGDALTSSRRLEPQEYARLLFELQDRRRRLTVEEP